MLEACKKPCFNLKFRFQISEDAARDEYGRIITGPKARVDKSEITNAYRIYVSTLPLDIKWQDVKDIFRSRIGDVSHCKLFTDQVIILNYSQPPVSDVFVLLCSRTEVPNRRDASRYRDL